MTESFTKAELRYRIGWYIKLRWFIIAGLGTSGIVPQFLQEGWSSQVVQNFEIAAAALAINTVFLIVNSIDVPGLKLYRLLAAAQLLFDVSIMSGVLYFNGGIETPNVMLYVIPIVMSGALLGRKAIYITGISAALIYDLMLSFDHLGVLTPQNILAPELHTNSNYVVQALFFIPAMLLTITVISDYVAKFIRERSELSSYLQVVTEQKAEIAAIIKSLGSALVVIDTKGVIILVNDAFEHFTGWTKDEIVGTELIKSLPLLDENGRKVSQSERPILKVLNAAKLGSAAPVERISRYYYARKNGTIFPFVGSLSPIVVNDKVIGATTVFDDATSTKQMQQLRSNFVALASHQLKTPLGEIRGYAQNMLSGILGQLTPKQTQYLASIDEIALRCSKLIGNLLDINIIEQGNLRLNLQPTRLKGILDNVLKIHQNRIRQKQLRIKIIEVDPEMQVIADPDKLVEIIANVVDNAINYTKTASQITIETKPDHDQGWILVTDQGQGIDKKTANEMFKRDSVLSGLPASTHSSGLGLYLSKELLGLQKGQISVLSSSKEGSTIAIKLPLGSRTYESYPTP